MPVLTVLGQWKFPWHVRVSCFQSNTVSILTHLHDCLGRGCILSCFSIFAGQEIDTVTSLCFFCGVSKHDILALLPCQRHFGKSPPALGQLIWRFLTSPCSALEAIIYFLKAQYPTSYSSFPIHKFMLPYQCAQSSPTGSPADWKAMLAGEDGYEKLIYKTRETALSSG